MAQSVLVAMPAYNQTNVTQTTASLVALTGAFCSRGIKMEFLPYSYFDLVRLRNMMLTCWYDIRRTTHMLFVDSDMAFEPTPVLRMLDYDVPLAGAIYPLRANAEKGKPKFSASFFHGTRPNEQGFMPVRGVGGGLMLIRRDCMDRLLEDDPTLIDDRPVDSVLHGNMMKEVGITRLLTPFNYLTDVDYLTVEDQAAGTNPMKIGEFGEDLSFCRRVRKAGMTVWGDAVDPIGHIGYNTWYGNWSPANIVREAEDNGTHPVWRLSSVSGDRDQAA